MGAPTEYYVRPTNGSNGAAGTSHAAAWQTLQYALDNITRDSTNGDRINLCETSAEGDDTLAANLSLTTYGTPSQAAPLIIQGYSTVAADGGIGGIDCNASYSMFTGSENSIHLADLNIHNKSATNLIAVNNYCTVERCVIHDCYNPFTGNAYTQVRDCHFYDYNGVLVMYGHIRGCFFDGTQTKRPWAALRCDAACIIERNIFLCTSNMHAIDISTATPSNITHNSILCLNGSGTGVRFSSSARDVKVLSNNLIEGFGFGKAIDFNNNTISTIEYCNNTFYGNSTNELNKPAGEILVDSGNETAGATLFAKSGSATAFSNRFVYYAPADVGNVQNGAHPDGVLLDRGAVQHEDPAGGGGGGIVGMAMLAGRQK